MRMQFNAAQVDNPCQPRRIVHNNFFRGSARRKRKSHGTQPIRALPGRTLLIERLPFRAMNEPLEDDWTILNSIESTGSDAEIIANQFDLRKLGLSGKIGFVRMSDADLPPVDYKYLCGFFFAHIIRLPDSP